MKRNASGTPLVRFRQLTPEMSNYSDYMDVVDILNQASTYNGLLGGQDASKMTVLADGTTTANTLSSRFAQQYNVKDYGATGNGTTNDTVAIQAAIDAADNAQNKGVVFFPPGVYIFSTLSISSFVTLQGSGWWLNANATWTFNSSSFTDVRYIGGTILRSSAASGSAISFVASAVGQIGIKDIAITGPGSGSAIGLQIGFATDSSHKNPTVASNISNVFVGNFPTGVSLEWVEDSTFIGLRIKGCTTGLSLILNANNNSFTNLDISACATGLSIDESCITNSFYAPVLQYNTGSVASIAGLLNVFYNPYIENPGSSGVSINGDAVNGAIGCALHDAYLSTVDDDVTIGVYAFGTIIDNYISHAGAVINNSGTGSVISSHGTITSEILNLTNQTTSAPTLTLTSNLSSAAHGASETLEAWYANGNATPLGKVSMSRVSAGSGQYDVLYVYGTNFVAQPTATQGAAFQVLGSGTASSSIGSSTPGVAPGVDLHVSQWSTTGSTWKDQWVSQNIDATTGAHLVIPTAAVGRPGISIRQINSQTANPFNISNASGNTVFFAISPDGTIITMGSAANHITFGSVSPASGTWAQGDQCFNTGTVAGGSPGWVCTAAGTPGTWKAMANVSA